MRVALYDYGAGNLPSLGKAVESSGAEVSITSDWPAALAADALVLPGVGAFGPAARALPADRTALRKSLDRGFPCLGICLGMQLLYEGSEEAVGPGLGVLSGRVRRLGTRVVPHMGWNDVSASPDPLFEGIDRLVAYYAHSYVCAPTDPDSVLAWSTYDGERFPAAVRAGRCWGVQFHPEKSSAAGVRLIHNFVRLAGGAA